MNRLDKVAHERLLAARHEATRVTMRCMQVFGKPIPSTVDGLADNEERSIAFLSSQCQHSLEGLPPFYWHYTPSDTETISSEDRGRLLDSVSCVNSLAAYLDYICTKYGGN